MKRNKLMESIDKSLECVLEKNMRPWGHSNSTWSLNFVITIKNQFYIWTNAFAWQQRVMSETERERSYDGFPFIVVWPFSIYTLQLTLEFPGYQESNSVVFIRFYFCKERKFLEESKKKSSSYATTFLI